MAITGSTFSNNSAVENGAGIYAISSTLSFSNSTFSGNSADQSGGGIYNEDGALTLTNNTFSGNSAGTEGEALYNSLGLLTVTNSILANSPSGDNCFGEIIDGGHNIDSGGACGFDPANGSLPYTDPLLGPLQDNGGPTWTHALVQGSPAVDSADPLACPQVDQRGVPRPLDGDGDGDPVCDIGSYELDDYHLVPIVEVIISGPSSGEVLNSYSFTASVTPISATLPVTYMWQATGQMPVTHTRGLSDTASFQWELVGIKAITLTVSNISTTVNAGHLITITDIPISGLLAGSDSPTWLGSPTTLSATVAGGTNVNFTWVFGDGTSGMGAVLTHTYASEGVYTALVTAANPVGSMTAATEVTVLAPPPPPPMEDERIYLPLIRK
jgi:predicted outer membrane repeat protein